MEVKGRRTKSGRYNLRYDPGQVHVAITQVTRADAGNYRVGVTSSSLRPGTYQDFQLVVRRLCENVVDNVKPSEYSASKGADLTISCDLGLEPNNRKFLCRNDCTKFLIDTNDLEGASAKYRIEFVSRNMFNVTIRDLSGLDSGLYRCGVGRETSPNNCQQFRVNVIGSDLNVPNDGKTNECQEITDSGPNDRNDGKTEEGKPTESTTDLSLLCVVGLLVAVVVILVVLLIVRWKKTQTHLYVNTSPNPPTRPEALYPNLEYTFYNSSRVYDSLRPETREEVYSTLN